MKVVLFCGGLGMRIREYPESVPKPMITIGYRPILWHVMKYYAHFGHKDFILSLGSMGDAIKQISSTTMNAYQTTCAFTGEASAWSSSNSDIHDWNITFAETGMHEHWPKA